MLRSLVFDGPPVQTVAVMSVCALVLSICAWAIARALAGWLGKSALPVAPFFVAVTTPFFVVFAFLAAEIWTVNGTAKVAAASEVEAVAKLSDYIDAMPFPTGDLRQNLSQYVHEVERVEWSELRNREPVPSVSAALSGMRREAVRIASTGGPPALTGALFQAINQLADARHQRLAIGVAHGSGYRWGLIIVLAVFSHIAVALVHADRNSATVLALAVFSTATCAAVSWMAIYDSPYIGAATVEIPDLSAAMDANLQAASHAPSALPNGQSNTS